MSNHYCVIGSPVAHSLSPFIHNTLYEIYKIEDCVYSAIEVTLSVLNEFVNSLQEKRINGFNITMPLKTHILPYLTYIDFSILNGCNTVNVTSHGLFGYSTDAAGFYKSLTINGYDYKDNNIVFLGCGGVTRTLIKDAIQKGANKVIVLNRTLSKISDLNNVAQTDELKNWENYLTDCDILINTTPMGMKQCPSDLDYNNLAKLKKTAGVFDLIYEPPVTPLLNEASKFGLFTLNGLDMLIWQAFYAFDIFFNIMPTEDDYKTVKERIIFQKNQDSCQ